MRQRILLAFCVLLAVAGLVEARSGGSSHSSGGPVHVGGYTRKDGTYVHSYDRRAPGTAGDSSIDSSSPSATPDNSGTPRTQSSTKKFSHYETNSTWHVATGYVGARDSRGRIVRSESAKRAFMKMTGFPHGRPGYVIDHIIPLKRGGADDPSNMQWQTIEEAKAKDKWE